MKSETVPAAQGDTRWFVLAHWAPLAHEKDSRVFGCEKAQAGVGSVCLLMYWFCLGFSSNNRVCVHLYSEKWTLYIPGRQGILKNYNSSFPVF